MEPEMLKSHCDFMRKSKICEGFEKYKNCKTVSGNIVRIVTGFLYRFEQGCGAALTRTGANTLALREGDELHIATNGKVILQKVGVRIINNSLPVGAFGRVLLTDFKSIKEVLPFGR